MLVWVEKKDRLGIVRLHSDVPGVKPIEVALIDGETPDLTPYKTGDFAPLPDVDGRTDAEKVEDLQAQVAQLTQALKATGAVSDADLAAAAVTVDALKG